MQGALVTGSLEGLVAQPPEAQSPGPAPASTPAQMGTRSRAAGKRKAAASAADSAAQRAHSPAALTEDVTRGMAWPGKEAMLSGIPEVLNLIVLIVS